MKPAGHEKNYQLFQRIGSQKKLAHAYLLVGPKHVGKTLFACNLAETLLCRSEKGKPCLTCSSCRLFEAKNHPDFLINDSEEPIGVDEIRELIRFLNLKPYQSEQKIALISHFERLSKAAANSFLKTLEEPAPNTILILTSENQKNLLPTTVSRVQVVKFSRVDDSTITQYLNSEMTVTAETAQRIIALSGGQIGRAINLAKNQAMIRADEDFLAEFIELLLKGSYQDRIKR